GFFALLCAFLLGGWLFLLRGGFLLRATAAARRLAWRRLDRSTSRSACASASHFGADRFLLLFFAIFFYGTAIVATDVAVIIVFVLMSCSEGLIVKAHSSSRN